MDSLYVDTHEWMHKYTLSQMGMTSWLYICTHLNTLVLL